MKYKITWEEGGALTEFEGTMTIEEIVYFSRLVQGDERFDQLKFFIHDLRKADFSLINSKDMDMVVALALGASYTVASGKIAVIATDPHVIELNEYRKKKHEEFGLDWKIGIFPNETEARKWIDPTSRWR